MQRGQQLGLQAERTRELKNLRRSVGKRTSQRTRCRHWSQSLLPTLLFLEATLLQTLLLGRDFAVSSKAAQRSLNMSKALLSR
jgi:hypothetical protein